MMYVMPLSITGALNTVIGVVNGPVALMRGGASPVPRVVLSITRFARMIHYVSMAKSTSGGTTQEFSNFTRLLDKLLSVPHSKIKAELEAEKTRTKSPRDRARRKHAFRDVSATD
jgi:hypothetical protein